MYEIDGNEYCDCGAPATVEETSTESAITGPRTETEFTVIRFTCGHEIVAPTGRVFVI